MYTLSYTLINSQAHIYTFIYSHISSGTVIHPDILSFTAIHTWLVYQYRAVHDESLGGTITMGHNDLLIFSWLDLCDGKAVSRNNLDDNEGVQITGQSWGRLRVVSSGASIRGIMHCLWNIKVTEVGDNFTMKRLGR